MHTYLRAIGFVNGFTGESDIDALLDDLLRTYHQRKAVKSEDGQSAFVEYSKSFGPDIGIRMFGVLDSNGFHRLGYFPYLSGAGVTSEADISIEQKLNGAGYNLLCDDGRVGISLISFLQNPADFLQESIKGHLHGTGSTTTLTGLSTRGKILLPIAQPSEKMVLQNDFYKQHDSLVTQARNGSQEAIEHLTLEDMDTYAMITRRVMKEDILSIVDSYFMPHGLECDRYQILGTILFYTRVTNSLTDEVLYQLTLECNGMTFDVCINQRDLLGEPEEGRRFKGDVWLQGRINLT